jgi:hypothetical protein
MTPSLRIAAAGALAFALAACGQQSKSDPYLQNMPDAAALTIDTSASASSAGAVAMAAAVDPTPVESIGNDLAVVHQKAQQVNEALRDVFAHVDALTASGGEVLAGNVKQWGPVVRCVQGDGAGGCVADGQAKLLLRARRWSDHLGDFVVLATSVSGSAADYRPVLAGYLQRGNVDRRGAGKVWVNHENLHAAAAGFKGRGYLAAGFAAGPVAKRITLRMLDFTRNVDDPAGHPAITASFTAWKNGAGIVRARVAGFANLDKTTTALELGFWRGVWAASSGGRAFTVITGGDVAAGQYWFGRACYPAGATTPSYKEWYLCTRPSGPAACILSSGPGAVDPSVPTTFTSWSQTTCAAADTAIATGDRDEVLPPAGAPGTTADDASDEDGDHTGLLPEPCPSTDAGVMTPDQTPPNMSGPGLGGMM